MDFWHFCAHEQTSPPDEMGDAICGDCGAKVRITLTRAGFMDFADTIYRDFGMVDGHHYRHSKRCVRLEGGRFLCADDCRMDRRSTAT